MYCRVWQRLPLQYERGRTVKQRARRGNPLTRSARREWYDFPTHVVAPSENVAIEVQMSNRHWPVMAFEPLRDTCIVRRKLAKLRIVDRHNVLEVGVFVIRFIASSDRYVLIGD